MTRVCFKIVYMSLVVLDLYKIYAALYWFHNSTGLATCF